MLMLSSQTLPCKARQKMMYKTQKMRCKKRIERWKASYLNSAVIDERIQSEKLVEVTSQLQLWPTLKITSCCESWRGKALSCRVKWSWIYERGRYLSVPAARLSLQCALLSCQEAAQSESAQRLRNLIQLESGNLMLSRCWRLPRGSPKGLPRRPPTKIT